MSVAFGGASRPVDACAGADLARAQRWGCLFVRKHLHVATIAFVVTLGIGMRVWGVLADRSLWSDESALVGNILTRSFAGLLLPLEDDQSAPLAWLWAQKVLSGLIPDFELALRLLPLASGVVALIVFAWFCIRFLRRTDALFAITALALLPTYLLYAGEVKQYMTDLLFSAVLMLFAFRGLEGKQWRWHHALALAFTGVIAILFSNPAAFVLGGVGSALFLHSLNERRHRDAIVIAGIALLWLAVFAALYLLVYGRQPEAVAAMRGYWQHLFAPVPPLNVKDVFWYYKALLAPAESALYYGRIYQPGQVAGSALACLVFLLGACSLARRQPLQAVALLLPLVLALSASALKAYPFGSRFLMFAAPQILVCIAVGVGQLFRMPDLPRPVAAAVPILLLALPLGVTAMEYARADGKPFETADSHSAMQALAANYRPGDAIYVYSECLPDFRLQRERYGLADAKVLAGHHAPDALAYFYYDIERMRQHRRVWLLYCTHMMKDNNQVYLQSMELILKSYAAQQHSMGDLKRNWSVTLYEFDPEQAFRKPAMFAKPDYSYAPSHPSLILRNDEN
ncbi:MAG: glycosyltransferase family 39 protein [Defluviicoccus sp.]|nr:glycosyltransferase family 39 protein [Defluviicoccus sp.]